MKLDDNVIAIAASDFHIDEYAWSDRPTIRGDSMWAFEWVVKLAIENQLPIIAAGDILDKQLNNANVTGFVKSQLDMLSEAGRSTVYFIQGQHDLQPLPWLVNLNWITRWLDGLGHTINLRKHLSGPCEARVHGIDWTPADKIQAKLDAIPPGTEIVVMHQVTKQLMEELGPIKTFELDATKIPHATLLILGDFHRTRTKKVVGASGQNLTIISPGSTNMRSIDEPAEKNVVLIKSDLSTEFMRIPTRPKFEFNITDESELESFTGSIDRKAELLRQQPTELPEHIRKPLVWVKFNAEIPGAYNRIREAVGECGHLFTKCLESDADEKEWKEQEDIIERHISKQIDELGPLACLPLLVDREEDPLAFSIIQRMLTEGDPVAVLEEERKRFIN